MPYLNNINYLIDDQIHINHLDYIRSDVEKQKKYVSLGAEYHYRTDKSPAEMAYWVLSQFLKEHEFTKDKIDTLIFTTDNLDESDELNVLAVNSLINELGIPQAFPIFQGHSNCANICTCFNTAYALVKSGQAKDVLIVSVDKIGEKDQDYMMDPEMSVLSDAAICLWISSTPVSGALKIEAVFQKNNPLENTGG